MSEIDHQTAVGGGSPGDAMTSAAHGDLEAGGATEIDGGHHIGGRQAAGDERRALVDHAWSRRASSYPGSPGRRRSPPNEASTSLRPATSARCAADRFIASSLDDLALNARLWLTLRRGPVTNVSAECHGRSNLGGTMARVGTAPRARCGRHPRPAVGRDRQRSIRMASRAQRLLLAVLLVEANRVVSADRLADELWPDDVPATPPARCVRRSRGRERCCLRPRRW